MEDNFKIIQLIELLARKSGVKKEEIKMETSIEDGLGITGEDAAELIKEISCKFEVNIEDFIFAKYFNDEPSIFSNYRKITPLTVHDLWQFILQGKLSGSPRRNTPEHPYV